MEKMENRTNRALAVAAMAAAIALPGAVSAGGYGSAGVKDDRVSNYASAGDQVWCTRLDRNVPQALAAEMNCRGTPTASRTTRSGLAGFFSRLRSNPDAKYPEEDDDNDSSVASRAPRPDKPEKPTETAVVNKWERLAELNVTPENFQEQDAEFQNAVGDYLSTHGADEDWSGFNPKR